MNAYEVTTFKNAIIESAIITTEERGLLSAQIQLSADFFGVVFGGYVLYLPKSFKHHGGPNYAGHFIYRVMEIAGVERWDQLVGKAIRTKFKDNSIFCIGHIIKDDWFDPSHEFKNLANTDSIDEKEENE